MKNIFISPTTKIIQAMRSLASVNTRCLIVTRKDRYFLGTLNDGDLRRGILKGLSGKETIKTIYQKKPIVVYEKKFSTSHVRNIMRKNLFSSK